jgi:PilZ domain
MSSAEHDRRRYARAKAKVPVEVNTEDGRAPIRGNTSDLSLGGCYIETIFPFPIGTELEMKIQIGNGTVVLLATVVTCDPQVGNGIAFARVLPEDFNELSAYLKSVQEEEQAHAKQEEHSLESKEKRQHEPAEGQAEVTTEQEYEITEEPTEQTTQEERPDET